MANIVYSIVVPCFNEQEVLPQTHQRLSSVMKGMNEPYEILYINDGSRDNTLPVLKKIYEADEHVVVISFSRNFGQQAASSAGLDAARGKAVILIDADLQDPPEVIPEMAAVWKQGDADIVYGKRKSREGETAFKKLTSAMYYRTFRFLTGNNAPLDTGDFRLMDRKVVDQLVSMGEHNRYLRGMIGWVGFTQVPVEFERKQRAAGETKYGFKQMMRLAMDGIFAFSIKPLTLANRLGTLCVFGSVTALIVQLILLLTGADITATSFALTGIYLLLGFLFMSVGLMGNYLGRVYEEAKNRPLYIVDEFHRKGTKALKETEE